MSPGSENRDKGRSHSGKRRRRSGRSRHQGGQPGGPKNGEKTQNQQSKANMVVLIDDDPAYVEMESLAIVHYLTGYNPMGFSAPSRALNYITNPRNSNRICLVLLDLEMPRVDGHTVQEILQVLKQSRNIPVAIVSAHNTAENIESALKLGAVGFLPKAFTMDVFVRFVKTILRTGHVDGWQCGLCGKLVPAQFMDMLNMRPIKCSFKGCDSTDFREVVFRQPREK